MIKYDIYYFVYIYIMTLHIKFKFIYNFTMKIIIEIIFIKQLWMHKSVMSIQLKNVDMIEVVTKPITLL